MDRKEQLTLLTPRDYQAAGYEPPHWDDQLPTLRVMREWAETEAAVRAAMASDNEAK
ncbi:MAG: hypothetical protein J0L81_11245 [Caulobacterales bacterium]|jgi:hypothetical protein|nr:hypothetical protein [Caulobacterales bacterium]